MLKTEGIFSLSICFQVKYECVWESCLQLMGCSSRSSLQTNVFSSNQKIGKKPRRLAGLRGRFLKRNNWSSHTFWSPIGISLKLTHVIIDSLETITLHPLFPFWGTKPRKRFSKGASFFFVFFISSLSMHFFHSKCYCLFYATKAVKWLLKKVP